MTNFRIDTLSGETIMVKTKEEIKAWASKYNVTDKDGNKVDLRKARSGMVVKANEKFLRVHTTLATAETLYKNR